jgi:phosphohistidine phosphatase
VQQQPDHGSPRTIALMRHAKAEDSAGPDLGRELTERGRADAEETGSWLAERGFVPDHVLVSAAARTRQSWDCLAAGAGWDLAASYDEGLYAAGPDTALDLVRAISDDAHTLLVIGHNPTIAYLAQLLDDGEGDADVLAQMAAGYPTSAVTILEHDGGAWSELEQGAARVVAFHAGPG